MSCDVYPLRRLDNKAPLRWKSTHGDPTCIVEYILQHSWLLVPYIAAVVTLILAVQLTGFSLK